MQNITFCEGEDRKFRIVLMFVVTEVSILFALVEISSSLLSTVSSEQTHKYCQDSVEWNAHSCNVCASKVREGKKTNVNWLRNACVIQSEVRVLPVPQAITRLPRDSECNPSFISSIADS